MNDIVTLSKEELAKYDFIPVVDNSGSMADPSTKNSNVSRIVEVKETITALIRELSAIDTDGLPLITFNNNVNVYENVNAEKIDEVFSNIRPIGGTNLLGAIQKVIEIYQSTKKPTVALVFTDGAANQGTEDLIKKTIIDFSQTLNADEDFAFGFIQVANDPAAAAFLKSLDDDLVGKGAKFDIVDVTYVAEAEQLTIEQLISKTLQG